MAGEQRSSSRSANPNRHQELRPYLFGLVRWSRWTPAGLYLTSTKRIDTMKNRFGLAGMALAAGILLSLSSNTYAGPPGGPSRGGGSAGQQGAGSSANTGAACRAACWGGSAAAAQAVCPRIPNPVGQALCYGAAGAAASICSDRCPTAPSAPAPSPSPSRGRP